MDTSANRVAEHQRQALNVMLDTLGLRSAWEEVSRTPKTQALARTVANAATSFPTRKQLYGGNAMQTLSCIEEARPAILAAVPLAFVQPRTRSRQPME